MRWEQPQIHRHIRHRRARSSPLRRATTSSPRSPNSPYVFNGQVHIALNGSSLTVTTESGTVGPLPFPANGVVYVENGTCSNAYSPFKTTYPSSSGCGNVYVHGNYSGQLTIASENDIIVDGNLTNSGGGMLGLIANNFVRVYHPCSGREQRKRLAEQSGNRRRDPGDQPLVHRRQLQLRQPAGNPERHWSNRPEIPRPGWHIRRGSSHRLPEELRLRRSAPLHRAAALRRPGPVGLDRRTRDDRLGVRGSWFNQALSLVLSIRDGQMP